jgi:hypothetical protein
MMAMTPPILNRTIDLNETVYCRHGATTRQRNLDRFSSTGPETESAARMPPRKYTDKVGCMSEALSNKFSQS